MQLQPAMVVALDVPALQNMQEPAMGYPNNVVYPGLDVAFMMPACMRFLTRS